MPVSQKRLDEIAAIADEDIGTSDIPEADEAWFEGAKLVRRREAKARVGPIDDMEKRRSAATVIDSPSLPRPGS